MTEIPAIVAAWVSPQAVTCSISTTTLAELPRPRPAPRRDALAYSVRDASALSGWGKTKIWRLIREGKLPVTRAAGRVEIIGDSLRSLLTTAD